MAEDYKESVDEPVATLLVEPFVGEQSLQPGREEQETGVMPEGSDGEVRVDLTEETEVDPLMRDEPRTSHASHVQSVPAEDIITGRGSLVQYRGSTIAAARKRCHLTDRSSTYRSGWQWGRRQYSG